MSSRTIRLRGRMCRSNHPSTRGCALHTCPVWGHECRIPPWEVARRPSYAMLRFSPMFLLLKPTGFIDPHFHVYFPLRKKKIQRHPFSRSCEPKHRTKLDIPFMSAPVTIREIIFCFNNRTKFRSLQSDDGIQLSVKHKTSHKAQGLTNRRGIKQYSFSPSRTSYQRPENN